MELCITVSNNAFDTRASSILIQTDVNAHDEITGVTHRVHLLCHYQWPPQVVSLHIALLNPLCWLPAGLAHVIPHVVAEE